MIRRHIATVGIWAAGAFAVSMAVMQPRLLNADDVVSLNLLMAPKLTVGKVTLSAKFTGPQSNPANTKSFPIELTAVNSGNETVTVPYKLDLLGRPKTNPLSRTPSFPVSSWSSDTTITLQPGETKRVTAQANSSTQFESYSIQLSSTADKPADASAKTQWREPELSVVMTAESKP